MATTNAIEQDIITDRTPQVSEQSLFNTAQAEAGNNMINEVGPLGSSAFPEGRTRNETPAMPLVDGRDLALTWDGGQDPGQRFSMNRAVVENGQKDGKDGKENIEGIAFLASHDENAAKEKDVAFDNLPGIRGLNDQTADAGAEQNRMRQEAAPEPVQVASAEREVNEEFYNPHAQPAYQSNLNRRGMG